MSDTAIVDHWDIRWNGVKVSEAPNYREASRKVAKLGAQNPGRGYSIKPVLQVQERVPVLQVQERVPVLQEQEKEQS